MPEPADHPPSLRDRLEAIGLHAKAGHLREGAEIARGES